MRNTTLNNCVTFSAGSGKVFGAGDPAKRPLFDEVGCVLVRRFRLGSVGEWKTAVGRDRRRFQTGI